jgi:hypothetical protein
VDLFRLKLEHGNTFPSDVAVSFLILILP